jgi:glycosyltransferase involved in cell wall biosynthesis
METLAAGVWRSMHARRPDAVLIAHGGSNRTLPWFVVTMLPRLAVLLLRRRVELVVAGDVLVNALVAPLTRLAGVPRCTMVMGLDLLFDNPLYRVLVRRPLRRTDSVMAISDATARVAGDIGVSRDHVHVVRLGIPVPPAVARDVAADGVRRLLGLDDDVVVLLTLGRVIPRKGARWFVEEVMPRLPGSAHYVVAGRGPDEDAVREAAVRAGVAGRVHVLGRVDEHSRDLLLTGADLFVQPNVPVPGDMEGFGLVTIEAALRGTPVVAADLEGIKDAVIDGRTGLMLPPGDARAWADRLRALLAAPTELASIGARFRSEAERLYSEDVMGEQIAAVLWAAGTEARA